MKPSKDQISKSIKIRGSLAYLGFLILAILIIYKIFYFNYVIGEELRNKAHKLQEKREVVAAKRGNIYGANGELLAVSIPSYNIYFDLISNKPDSLFNKHVDSLALCLNNLFKDRSAATYKSLLKKGRRNKKRGMHYLIKRNVSHLQLEQLKTFPILNLGKYTGGLIAEQRVIRRMPYGSLAKRTIGIFNRDAQEYQVGLEGAFDSILQGADGVRYVRKAERGEWISISPANDTMPNNGLDIVTTIDVEIQDIAERALMDQVTQHGAKKGCVIVMDVATGEIKALANLGRDQDNRVVENYNYAIADAADPGSTFKAVSMLVALDDGVVNMNDSVVTGKGYTVFCRHTIRDTHKIGNGHISLSDVIVHSSNVGISKIIHQHYNENPQKFIDGVYRMNMNEPTGISLAGEHRPYIKNTKDKSWSCTSLPWISYGYEMQVTPLQTLCFYNTVANGGKRMKPMLVKEVKEGHRVVKRFEPTVINEQIARPEAIKNLQSMLRGVVEHGTGKKLNKMQFPIAGKTGTAQIANRKQGYDRNRNNYQSSFVGYFPADNPKYSCIAVISNTTSGVYYGGAVALPVFQAIANRLYSRDLDTGIANPRQDSTHSTPDLWYKIATKQDFKQLHNYLHTPFVTKDIAADTNYLICMQNKQKEAEYQLHPTIRTQVPKLIGMTATDAVYLCENMGMKVQLTGKGFVHTQDPKAGTPIAKAKSIQLTLKE